MKFVCLSIDRSVNENLARRNAFGNFVLPNLEAYNNYIASNWTPFTLVNWDISKPCKFKWRAYAWKFNHENYSVHPFAFNFYEKFMINSLNEMERLLNKQKIETIFLSQNKSALSLKIKNYIENNYDSIEDMALKLTISRSILKSEF